MLILLFAFCSSFSLPEITLGDGSKIPLVGLGTAFGDDCQYSSHISKDSCAAYDATYNWLKLGNRMIDTANMYCNQGGIGQAIKDLGIEREDVPHIHPKASAIFEKTLRMVLKRTQIILKISSRFYPQIKSCKKGFNKMTILHCGTRNLLKKIIET